MKDNNAFVKNEKKDLYLFDTTIENIFINEYLPMAPGNYVKIYIFALMYAEHEQPINNKKMSNILGIAVDEINTAWIFWEEKNIVKRKYTEGEEDYQVVFLSQREAFYGAIKSDAEKEPIKNDEKIEALESKELKYLFTTVEDTFGRTITQKEMKEINDAVRIFEITADVLSYSIKYCAEYDKTNINYVIKVAKNWKEHGCEDISQVKEHLDKNNEMYNNYKTIFKEIGFSRAPNQNDIKIMERWFNEMGYKFDAILKACRKTAGLREPSLNYVNKVLENWQKDNGGKKSKSSGQNVKVNQKILRAYYESVRKEDEKQLEMRKSEVGAKVPMTMKIDELINKISGSINYAQSGTKGKDDRKKQYGKINELAKEKKKILEENGYPADYLEMKYLCSKCKDTGITEDGRVCSCVTKRAEEANIWNKKRSSK